MLHGEISACVFFFFIASIRVDGIFFSIWGTGNLLGEGIEKSPEEYQLDNSLSHLQNWMLAFVRMCYSKWELEGGEGGAGKKYRKRDEGGRNDVQRQVDGVQSRQMADLSLLITK